MKCPKKSDSKKRMTDVVPNLVILLAQVGYERIQGNDDSKQLLQKIIS